MKKFLLATLFLLQPVAAMAASGGHAQDRARINDVVARFVQQQTAALPGKTAYRIEEIDRRIALPQCSSFEAFLPTGSQLAGKTSVGVRCAPSPHKNQANASRTRAEGWSILVPVQIRFNLDLLTSARQLPPGHTLQEGDLASQSTETSRMEGFIDPRQVVGKVLRYGIAAGQVLREDMLRQPYSVTQRQVVPLAVQGNGFSIRSEGVALNNAGEGQPVQVRVGSSRVISGVARAGGVVEIAP